MTPLALIGWAAAIAAGIVIIGIAVAVTAAVIEGARRADRKGGK